MDAQIADEEVAKTWWYIKIFTITSSALLMTEGKNSYRNCKL